MRRLAVMACLVGMLGVMGSQALPAAGADFSPEAVDKAIEKGIKFLRSQATDKQTGLWHGHEIDKGPKHFNYHPYGPSALATYALIEAGVSPRDPLVAKALQTLKKVNTAHTYTIAMRACAYRAAVAHDAKEYITPLRADVRTLIRMLRGGSYGYFDPGRYGRKPHHAWDNSNGQYGVLGVWMGLLENIEIPRAYWQRVMDHWKRYQKPDGSWGYRDDATRAGMCAAGVASMFVCFDSLRSRDFLRCSLNFETDRDYRVIKKGLDWFDQNFEGSMRGRVPLGHGNSIYYYLYGIERIGLASGYKYFGKADWYKIGAERLLREQQGNGRWAGPWGDVVSTSYALLFLCRGRNAILFNKLEFAGDWNNRPRDLAFLTRWLSRKYENTVNWQIVNLRAPITDLHDAPILYISGAKGPKFSKGDLDKLRTFVNQGGTLFSVTECNGAGFKEGMLDAYGKMFPDYKVTQCPPDHPLYTIYFKLRGRPRFYVVSNGARVLAVHTDTDLSQSWQGNRTATAKYAFEAAANVYMYVTDMSRSLRRRGVALWPAKAGFTPKRTVKIARVKYKGNYDPEPLAYGRFAIVMGRETRTRVDVTAPMPAAQVPASGAHLAVLTGTSALTLSETERDALKKFVASGGTLFLDAFGGDPPGTKSTGFYKSAAGMLRAMYPGQDLRRISITSPLYSVDGLKIARVAWRRSTKMRMGGVSSPDLRAIMVNGRAAVILSRHDITAGLLGCPAASVYGYSVRTAFKLMRNISIFAARKK